MCIISAFIPCFNDKFIGLLKEGVIGPKANSIIICTEILLGVLGKGLMATPENYAMDSPLGTRWELGLKPYNDPFL